MNDDRWWPRALAIAVPARDEARTLERSIRAILDAVDRAGPIERVVVAVACDSCTDDTVDVATALADAHRDELVVAVGRWGTAGGARAAAARLALDELARSSFDPAAIWLATSDADSAVDSDWLRSQLSHAGDGAVAIAGIVELLDDHDRTDSARRAFDALYAFGDERAHPHVHGANLGVRVDAYLAAGGFRALASGEDHDLWRRLVARGWPTVSAIDVRVSTSARRSGRAAAGFAHLLDRAMSAADREAGA